MKSYGSGTIDNLATAVTIIAMTRLKEGRIYAIDGGFFRAKYNETRERFELWTYAGLSGTVIARTGFEMDGTGHLYHRVFDFETREQLLFEAEGYTVEDLEEVDEAMFKSDDSIR